MPKKSRASPTPLTASEASRLKAEVKEVLGIATDAHRAVNRQLKQFSRKTKLTERGLHILGLIVSGLDRPSLLIDHFDVLPSTITVETDKLVAAGLLVRRPHPSDRRVTTLELTERGLALEREAMELLNAMFAPRLAQIPPEELKACTETLRKIIYPIDAEPRNPARKAPS